MSDPYKGKYQKLCKAEFATASNALAGRGGELTWGAHDYQAFLYREPGVCLVFYPHKVRNTGNYHIRVRDQGSKNKNLAGQLMKLLDSSAGFNCTFSKKGGHS